ncbi:MAG: STAS domain-containing protein [Acidimicrobiales bacterium]|nr:STAS domain-containing protein [Acidimicrobiales bacterium]
MTRAQLHVERGEAEGSPVVISVKGEVDLANAPELKETLEREGAGRDVVLDLSELAFMDSSAIAVIVQARSDALGDGRTLSIRNPSDRARRLLELVALDFLIEGEARD